VTRKSRLWIGVVAAVFLIAVGVELVGRVRAENKLAENTRQAAIPVVRVMTPQAGAPDQELTLPGNTQPFSDAPIYARTSGYVKKWRADIGQHVKQGDVLAEIDSPEVDQQLRSARADLATAEANARLAKVTAERYSGLYKTDSVTKQDRDNAVGAFDAANATVQAREADVARLQQLQSFEKVTAPFDGVVTARNTDIGNLIDAGAAAAGRELFHLAAIDRLRIYVAVPEAYVRAARPDSSATVTFDQFPGRKFTGHVARNSNAIDPIARTLTVEVDVDNPKGEIMPGAYGFVHFSVSGARQGYTIPANTLLFRAEGLRVGVVRDGKAVLVPITIDRDYGDKVEVVSGLEASDQVILDPSDSLVSGTPVKVDEQKDQKKGA
jgi:RND family efflux transporter MFP subunit